MPKIFMYAGQGSQYYQMGKDLFNGNPQFQELLRGADAIFEKYSGRSVINEIYKEEHPKSLPFTDLLYSHPAIFLMEYALTALLAKKNIVPDMVVGSSLGEFAAAVAAGYMDFETALQLVIAQAEIVKKHCKPGAMLAVLSEPALYEREEYLHNSSEIAAVNFASHFVVSGKKDQMQHIETRLQQQQITCQMLPVNYAFHSSLITPAKAYYQEAIVSHIKKFKKNSIPFYSCVSAAEMETIEAIHFWEVIKKPILFKKTMDNFKEKNDIVFIDLSPSGTLATFAKYNLPLESKAKAVVLMTPFGNDNQVLENALEAIQ